LCCPTSYDSKLLAVIPNEVLERDYGCGDPSAYLKSGETVLDLGSGGGKICFIASQIVGETGRVIGVDINDEMLALAAKHQPTVAKKLGYSNVEFRRSKIQDLQGIIDDSTIDIVVSNCVLNLVESSAKPLLFREMFRVLRPSGRAIISDIVANAEVPEHMQNDPELWSGCISGALTERAFIGAFESAGFQGVTILERQQDPWQTVEGIEFRSVTVAAYRSIEAAQRAKAEPVVTQSGCC